MRKIERQLKNRFPIGSHVSEQRIIQDFQKQVGVCVLGGGGGGGGDMFAFSPATPLSETDGGESGCTGQYIFNSWSVNLGHPGESDLSLSILKTQ